MEWKNEHDIMLCREILVSEPLIHKERTTERGKVWGEIAERLKTYVSPKFRETIGERAVRERFKLLGEKYKQRVRQQEKTSGINVEPSEFDIALEEICEEEEAAEEMHEVTDAMKRKVEEDREKAGDIRTKGMEKLGETKKRKSEDESNARKKKRSLAGLNIECLREKSEREHQLRQRELEIQKYEKEEMVRMQQQMFAMMQQQQQQQQNQILMTLLNQLLQK